MNHDHPMTIIMVVYTEMFDEFILITCILGMEYCAPEKLASE